MGLAHHQYGVLMQARGWLRHPATPAQAASLRVASSESGSCPLDSSITVQVAGILQGSAKLTGRALDSDCIVEPVRGPLIPGFAAVKKAARAAGKQI